MMPWHNGHGHHNNFVKRVRDALLRGGRISKYKGQAASYAPGLGKALATGLGPVLGRAVLLGSSVSVRALGARAFAVTLAAAGSLALTVTGANAGVCTETFAGSGIFVCSGAAAGGDVTQTPTPPAGGALDVSTIAGFGITTAAGNAITMVNVAGDTDITFTDNNTSVITGNANGLYAVNNGTGLVSITATGAVTGTTGMGIQAYNNNGTSLTVNAQGAVTGNLSGVYVGNFGTGALSITTQAVTASVLSGIIATNSGAGTSLTINAQGAVSGGNAGIRATNVGSGALSLTTQAVTSATGYGISAYNVLGTSLTINAQGAVSSGIGGIFASNTGSGALSLTTQAVTGALTNGISAINGAAGTSLTINAQGAVSGNTNGIYATNLGSGALSVTTQAVTGTTGFGIFANNSVLGTSLTINAQGAVSGRNAGIRVTNYGSGAFSITSQAVTSAMGYGIFANNGAAGTSLTINAQGAVSGGSGGIFASNTGSGDLSLTTQAVTGTTTNGILASNSGAGTDMTINAGGAVSGIFGIIASNSGTGATSITTQAVTGTTARGIDAFNSATGSSLTVTTGGDVLGASDGILARNIGTAGLLVTTQAVTGTAGRGIYAFNSAAGTSFTINAQGAVSGNTDGILARNLGTAGLLVTTQAVTGTTGKGISALNSAAGTSLTINAQGAVIGGDEGINAVNSGTGALSITTQAVTGTATNGIFALNSAAGTSFTINTQGAVIGGTNGIYAKNAGSGALSVTTQAVTGTTSAGINAQNDATGTNLTINTQGAVIGGGDGIHADNNGTGALLITAAGAVTGTGDEGIQASNSAAGTDMTIVVNGPLFGDDEGIEADNYGSGAVSITTTSTVIGTTEEGLDITNSAAGTSLTIVATGAVSSTDEEGIYVRNDGTGATTITTSGGVTGTAGIRVSARVNNSPTTINNSGAITGTAASGVAINFQGNGNDTLNLLPGSVINGTIDFGNGNDGLGGTNPNDIDTLNVAPGLNAVLTFADTSGGDSALASAPESASSNVAFFNGGTQAAAIDLTGFAASGVFLGTLTTAIFNSIDNNGSGPQGDQPLNRGISPAGGDAKSLAYGSGRRLWVSGFGGKQEVDGTSSQAGIDNRFGGAITGVEIGVGSKGAFGVFGGYAVSSLDIEYNAGDLKVDSAFGGAYWKIDTGKVRIQLALVAGSANQDTTRNIAGGTVARGEADGWFFSPSATLAVPIEGLSFPLIASGRVSYAGLFTDGYTETGVANPLTVSDRDVQVFNTRAQFTLPQTIANKNGSKTRIDWRAGVDAQFDGGSDNVALVVGGTPLSFSANLNDEVAGFLGASLIHVSENGMYTFTASGEVQSAFNGGYKAVGQIRALVNF